jgi:hypothetical protein
VVSALAVPVGLAVAFVINHTWLHRFARFVRVSQKFGDIDVWSYVMNSNIQPWVVVRDRDQDVMYDGWIAAFSDTIDTSELFLRDVKVFRNGKAGNTRQIREGWAKKGGVNPPPTVTRPAPPQG